MSFLNKSLLPATRFLQCRYLLKNGGVHGQVLCNLECRRSMKHWYKDYIFDLNRRKEVEQFNKPPLVVKRNTFLEWNFESELFAFGHRVGENFEGRLLTRALTDKQYALQEVEKSSELGLDKVEINHNEELAKEGRSFSQTILNKTLSQEFPKIPKEGIEAIVEKLLSEPLLAHISSSLGTKDLIFSLDYPPTEKTYGQVFEAIIGALLKSSTGGPERGEKFVQDFILTQLCGQDLNEFWDIPRPWKLLNDILKDQGEGAPEPRIIRETGKNTLLAVYVVGIYNQNKKLIGTGIGETLDIAQEMGARDALKGIFEIRDPRSNFKFLSLSSTLS